MMHELPHDTEVVLPQSRHIAAIASFLALACAAIAIPVAAQGDTQNGGPDAAPVPAAVLEARAHVEDVNADALADAPAAVGATCHATLDVPGIGDACRTPDGLLRVQLEDGRSSTIHGMDAPPLGASTYAPSAVARVASATVSDIDCVADTSYHYTLVYAHPANVASRYADLAPKLRTEAYKMSAFIDGESQSVDPRAGRHLPFSCDGGTPRVRDAQLAATGGGVQFDNVVQQLAAQGFDYNSANSAERYLLYIDAPSEAGAAGTGHVFTNDSRGDQTNANNNGGLFAMQYNFANGGNQPRWDVMVHELSHTMGAVVNAAPHASGIGHCNDGIDVMCYADGGSTSSYSTSTCAIMVLDCGRDDYFNPAPAAGSYLATHWNMAGAANHWLQQRLSGDQVPPLAPTTLTVTGVSNSAIGLAWTPASDNVAVASYRVAVRLPNATWRTAVTTARRTATITQLEPSTTYEVSVTAIDSVGNTGPAAVLTTSTNDRADTQAPSTPRHLTARIDLKAKRVTITWNDATDDIGVAGYEVHRLDALSTGRRAIRAAVHTTETTVPVPTRSLKPGVKYLYEVIARDSAGNVSGGALMSVIVPKDRVRPTAPAVRSNPTSGGVQLTWRASTDNVGVARYRVFQRAGSRWIELRGTRQLGPTATTIRVTGLLVRRVYAFRVTAIDAAGNAHASRALTVRVR
ncbi:MAG: Chitinase precursor [Thermoleophilia bacterium]|nr:Chitinase precursor [Thermoleophilia bacterium]